MGAPLITLRDVSVRLPGQRAEHFALQHISYTLHEGQHLALSGNNGAGKSTLLRLMRGDIWACAGEIFWHTMEGVENSPLAGRTMGALVSPAQQAMYQRQGWRLTGRELLFTGFDDAPLIYSQSKAEQDAAIAAMAQFLRITHLLDVDMGQCSQGQLRMLLLARALLRQPRVLLLDECTEGLDKENRTHFLEVLHAIAVSCTIVMTTHRADLLPDWIHDVFYLEQGHQRLTPVRLADGQDSYDTAKISLSDGDKTTPHTEQRLLGQALITLRNATVYVNGNEDFDGEQWVLHQEGHSSDPSAIPGDVRRCPALHNISWTLRQGEHWLIHGSNGSGKSTLLRLLAGDEYPAAGGSITRILPRHGGRTTILEEIRRGVRLVSDRGEALYSYDMTVLELICSGFDNTIGMYREILPNEEDAARALLASWRLDALQHQNFRMLSSGQSRLCFLARALMGEPEILLLDEPCSGLDASTRANYLCHLQKVAEKGVHIVLVSHHVADRIPAITRVARLEGGHLTVEQ